MVGACIWDAGPCFAFIFSFVAIGAITINLLFIDSWDAALGEEANSFFLTLVSTFVLSTDAGNWEEFGESARDCSGQATLLC